MSLEKMHRDDVYSPYKAAFHKEKLEYLKKGGFITPAFVQWDLTNRCNLNCSFCFYHINSLSDWDSKATMQKETVFRILKELKEMNVKTVEWTGGGEIASHPNYKEIFREANNLGFEQALVTNGTLLDEESIQLVKGFEWTRFSIDSATKETYKQIKKVDAFDKAISNLKRLLEVRDRKNVVGFSFIVCRENYKEIHKASILAKSLGCDNIRFSLAMTPNREKLFEAIWDICVKQIDSAKREQTRDFRVFAFSNRIYELSLEVLSEHCYYTDFVGVISPTGVYPCCRLKDDAKYNFGNLERHSFKEIWFGEKRKRFVENVRKNGCAMDCWMTEKNRFITYLLSKDPKHVNFV